MKAVRDALAKATASTSGLQVAVTGAAAATTDSGNETETGLLLSAVIIVGIALDPGAFLGRPRFTASHRRRCSGVSGRSFSGVMLRASRSKASKSFSSVFVLLVAMLISSACEGVSSCAASVPSRG